MIKVSAIVSVYNGDKFLRGRIDDLMTQTLYGRGELEIIVVNSASTDTTQAILEREYLEHITLIQTPFRESMYAAWNRAIKLAKGEYIVPANVDDRFRPDALYSMADHLLHNPDTGLVTAESIVTSTPNGTMRGVGGYEVSIEPPYTTGQLNFPVPTPEQLIQHCCIGNAPMWRKWLHEEYGYFDLSYLIAGDYEWALRLATRGVKMDKLEYDRNWEEVGALGLFYFHPSTQGRAYAEQSAYESRRAVLKWKPIIERKSA